MTIGTVRFAVSRTVLVAGGEDHGALAAATTATLLRAQNVRLIDGKHFSVNNDNRERGRRLVVYKQSSHVIRSVWVQDVYSGLLVASQRYRVTINKHATMHDILGWTKIFWSILIGLSMIIAAYFILRQYGIKKKGMFNFNSVLLPWILITDHSARS